MAAINGRDCGLITSGLIVGLAIAAFALSVGWNYGRVAGERHAQQLEQDWWEFTSKADVVTRWEEAHLPAGREHG